MKKGRRLLLGVTVVTVGFIWIHSCMSRAVSREESGMVMRLITPFLELFVGKGNVTDHLVRKLAHFAEFSVLGLELALLFHGNISKARTALIHGFGVTFLDETIQIFSGRGPAISDVWLDMAGVAAGIGLIHLARSLLIRKKQGSE